jgi:hypothetical protein
MDYYFWVSTRRIKPDARSRFYTGRELGVPGR